MATPKKKTKAAEIETASKAYVRPTLTPSVHTGPCDRDRIVDLTHPKLDLKRLVLCDHCAPIIAAARQRTESAQ